MLKKMERRVHANRFKRRTKNGTLIISNLLLKKKRRLPLLLFNTNMKHLTIGIILFCSTAFAGIAQLPAFEYVPYQSEARNKTIALPDFSVALKKRYIEEKAVYNKAATLFVVSDIEGEYEAFKQLLKAAGVIDNTLNWTFGKGHLVIAGD